MNNIKADVTISGPFTCMYEHNVTGAPVSNVSYVVV